jgi:hypothetical protein
LVAIPVTFSRTEQNSVKDMLPELTVAAFLNLTSPVTSMVGADLKKLSAVILEVVVPATTGIKSVVASVVVADN